MRIKIISGSYGHSTGSSVKVKTPKDKPFEVSDSEGARLIKLGIAEAADVEGGAEDALHNKTPDNSDNTPNNPSNVPDNSEEGIPSYSTDSTKDELQAIADEYCIDVPARATKAQLLELLDEYFSDIPVISIEDPQ
ncbi:MAG: hypothetical protein NC203_00365 [Firmicutes bacterium]|nr:hypothetical protein [[Eubacterium] siraeum]MCM1486792.1 hypothetical protein [Bacillota bacterium]